MSCDRAAQVHAYHDRQLGPAAREAFELHLDGCADCAGLLADLRRVSALVRSAPLPEVSRASLEHYYAAWDVSGRQRGLLRISSWLTAAAAAAFVGSLLLWPGGQTSEVATASVPSTWEPVALMPPTERGPDRPDELIELAQWMADDLSSEGIR